MEPTLNKFILPSKHINNESVAFPLASIIYPASTNRISPENMILSIMVLFTRLKIWDLFKDHLQMQ